MPSADKLLELLGSDLNRRILALASEEDRSADAIADHCDSSLPTVYRHIDDLQSAGLLAERVAYNAAGNHFKLYRTSVDSVAILVDDGSLTVSIEDVDDAGTEGAKADRPTPDGVEPAGTETVENVERPSDE